MDSTLHDMPAFLDPSYPFLFPYVSHTTADEVEVGSSPSSEAGPRMGVPLVSTSQSTSTNLFPNYSPNTCFNTSTHFHSTIPQDEPNWYTLDENPRFVYQPPYSIADHGDCAWLPPACQTGTPSPPPHHPPRPEPHSAVSRDPTIPSGYWPLNLSPPLWQIQEGYQAAASILLSTPGPENQPTGSPTLNALPMIPSTHYSSNIPPSHPTPGPTTSNSRNYLCFDDSKGVTQYQCLVCGRCMSLFFMNPHWVFYNHQ